MGRGARGRSSSRNTVTHADVMHTQSEAEVILEHLRSIMPIGGSGGRSALGGLLEVDDGFREIAKKHLALLESMRAEFKPARAYAQAQRQYLYAFDELDMAMMTMQLRSEEEALVHEHEKYFKLTEAELVVRNKELSDEKIVASADLSRAIGTLRYLEGLAASRRKSKAGSGSLVDRICPICHERTSDSVAVLTCGHLFCSECIMALIARARGGGRRPQEENIVSELPNSNPGC